MKKIITMAVCSVLLFACGGQTDSNSSEKTAAAEPAKKVDGAKIYKTYCVTCHGIYGDMGGSGAFDLTTSTLSLEERIQVITKGRNLMTPFEGLLSAEKIKAVAEYVETLRKEQD